MTPCPACGSESPDGSTHCVHCGAAFTAAGDEAPGHTSHFGDQDVKKLVARISREEEAAHDADGNLLAGLPRPKAASMVSPLRGGQTTATTRGGGRPEQRRARSASGSTVLGMPLYTTGEQGVIRPAATRASAISAAPGAGEPLSASIQSLGAFQDDLGGRRGSGALPQIEPRAGAPAADAPAPGERSSPPAAEASASAAIAAGDAARVSPAREPAAGEPARDAAAGEPARAPPPASLRA
ncbi:MAG: zinc ribbon domain-containing protein [Myxococcales bacterium]|nr:zinc ribbon domain-containing protein [Myxococcales bacterium]